MAKQKQPKRRAGLIALIVILVIIVLAVLLILLLPRQAQPPVSSGGESSASSAIQSGQSGQEEAEQPTDPGVELPMSLEDGALELTSLFQFDGINPDCGNQEGTNIASIQLKNTSDTYLSSADLTVTLSDGAQISFRVTDLPAGKSAMAFALDNRSIEADAICVDVASKAVFDPDAATQSDRVSVSVEGTLITLTNNTGEDIPELVIYCRAPLDEDYFGGMTYQYTINNLAANASTTVDATDCILGMAEVVRIEVNE